MEQGNIGVEHSRNLFPHLNGRFIYVFKFEGENQRGWFLVYNSD